MGAGAISYGPPEGQPGNLFYWGLAFAALAAVGWGAEGVLATSGMDFIEPAVALNVYYTISAILYVLSIIPLVSVIVFANSAALRKAESHHTKFPGTGASVYVKTSAFRKRSNHALAHVCNNTGVATILARMAEYIDTGDLVLSGAGLLFFYLWPCKFSGGLDETYFGIGARYGIDDFRCRNSVRGRY